MKVNRKSPIYSTPRKYGTLWGKKINYESFISEKEKIEDKQMIERILKDCSNHIDPKKRHLTKEKIKHDWERIEIFKLKIELGLLKCL